MARLVRNRRLDSRTARSSLALRHAPYWVTLSTGRALGYRKGQNAGSWLARYRAIGGARYQAVLGPADDAFDADAAAVLSYAQAQEAARDWFSELDRNHGKLRARYSVGEALDDYLDAFKGKSKGPTEWAIDRYIRPRLGKYDVTALTPQIIERFLHALAEQPATYRANRKGERKLRPTTGGVRARRASANRIFSIFKAAMQRAFAAGKVGSDEAWRRVKPFAKVDASRVRYLSAAEAVRLVNAASNSFRPLVQAALLTGCRWSELCRMRVEDVDTAVGVVLIPETKAGRPRYVHLSDEGTSLFEQLCIGKRRHDLVFTNEHGRAFGPSHQVRPMKEACERVGLAGVGFHILRHTYGSRLAMAGVPLAVVAEALGHSDERITRRHYAHLSPSYVRDSVRAGLGIMGIIGSTNIVSVRS